MRFPDNYHYPPTAGQVVTLYLALAIALSLTPNPSFPFNVIGRFLKYLFS